MILNSNVEFWIEKKKGNNGNVHSLNLYVNISKLIFPS